VVVIIFFLELANGVPAVQNGHQVILIFNHPRSGLLSSASGRGQEGWCCVISWRWWWVE
jgi:hypothetical protein